MGNDEYRMRNLPSVDRVLRAAPQLVETWGHEHVAAKVRATLSLAREQARSGPQARAVVSAGEAADGALLVDADPSGLLQQIIAMVRARLEQDTKPGLVGVFNLTGTVLHTNLGRASLPRAALDAVVNVARRPSNLEYDLQTGKRGDRDAHVEELIRELCGAEAATVVNNNAAAVLLTLNTLAQRLEVPVSRGELVEIGGSFRMPEIMRSAGCVLVEVGATNRTHLEDYANAIRADTALLLKVHTSNYEIRGFTHSVAASELARLAHDRGLPLVIDLGSGNLVDLAEYGLPAEPLAQQALADGADIVTFSGDKLLGGPQCGIIAGRRELVDRMKQNPLKRALRVDKMVLASLAEVLKLYRNPARLAQELPTLAALTRPLSEIQAQAERLAPQLAQALGPRYEVVAGPCNSQVGSGALPLNTMPSYGFRISALEPSDKAIRQLAAALRRLPVPVIGRISQGAYFLDCRCLDREDEFIAQLLSRGCDSGADSTPQPGVLR